MQRPKADLIALLQSKSGRKRCEVSSQAIRSRHPKSKIQNGITQDGKDMNQQRDGFASGLIAGTLIGGIVGGAIGALLAAKRTNESAPEVEPRRNANIPEANSGKRRRSQLKASSEQAIELARRSLEDKIAQLNETIDEVRLTLGQVNSNQPVEENSERSPQDS